MNLLRKLLLAALIALAPVTAIAQQATVSLPTTGPMSMGTFVSSWLNPGLAALLGCSSGTTAPAVTGQPATYQCWIDTSTTPKTVKTYDGASWVVTGYVDATNHLWIGWAAEPPNAQTGTSYTVLDTDRGKLVTLNNASAVAVTLPQAGASSQFKSNWAADFVNLGAGTVTITPTTSTINGASTLTLLTGQAARLVSDGTNYVAILGRGVTSVTCGTGLTGGAITTSGTCAVSYGTAANTAAQGNDSRIVNALQSGNNLSDVGSASTSRTNLGLGTAATVNTGTSGATIPLLNAANTWSGVQSFNDGDLSLNGATSGNLLLKAAGISGSSSIKFPNGTTDFTGTGGTSQVLKQVSAGAAITVGQLACSDLSNGAASCSTDTTNASNISSGTLAAARGGAGTITGALKGNGAGVVSQAACADLSNGATGCSTATGTSGATIPLLNGTNTWSGVQSVNSGDLALKGATSGTITLNAAATAGSNTITLPAGTTDFSATGGTSQVVKQVSAGAAFTVGQLACADLSNSVASCSTDATNASNISSGTLAIARGGTGQGSAAAARASSGLNIERITTQGDANYSILSTDRTVSTTTTLTAARTDTLPAANSVNPGQHILVIDGGGAINGANTLTVARAGSDTINGSTSAVISTQYAGLDLVSDGTSKWAFVPASAGGGSGTVTSVAAGYGAAGGTITTSGTISVPLIASFSQANIGGI